MKLHFEHKAFDALSLRELYDLLWLRDEVFVVGQRITAECEVDGLDPECIHVLGRDESGSIVATTRLFMQNDPVKVGRVAIHPRLQRQRLGRQLMHYVHEIMGDRPGKMSAQAYLTDWYTSLGWQALGDIYIEAEIPHQKMLRPAAASAE